MSVSRWGRLAAAVVAAGLLASGCTPMTWRTDIYVSPTRATGPPAGRGVPAAPQGEQAFRDAVRACDAAAGPLSGLGDVGGRALRDTLVACMEDQGYRVLSAGGLRPVETSRPPGGTVPAVSAYLALSTPKADADCQHEARRRLITSRFEGPARQSLHDSMVATCQRSKADGELVWDVVSR